MVLNPAQGTSVSGPSLLLLQPRTRQHAQSSACGSGGSSTAGGGDGAAGGASRRRPADNREGALLVGACTKASTASQCCSARGTHGAGPAREHHHCKLGLLPVRRWLSSRTAVPPLRDPSSPRPLSSHPVPPTPEDALILPACPVHRCRFGNASSGRPALVMVPGFSATIDSFPLDLLAALAAEQEVILVDNRGQGLTIVSGRGLGSRAGYPCAITLLPPASCLLPPASCLAACLLARLACLFLPLPMPSQLPAHQRTTHLPTHPPTAPATHTHT